MPVKVKNMCKANYPDESRVLKGSLIDCSLFSMYSLLRNYISKLARGKGGGVKTCANFADAKKGVS